VDTLSYKTISANKATVNKEWVIIDATNAPLGRLSTEVAMILRGKRKPDFTPHVDCGDNVIVVNAEKVRLTGKKMTDRKKFVYLVLAFIAAYLIPFNHPRVKGAILEAFLMLNYHLH